MIIPESYTGFHKLRISANGIDMISIDDIFTTPGGTSYANLKESQFINY
jgi:hypothetical protein